MKQYNCAVPIGGLRHLFFRTTSALEVWVRIPFET